MTWGRQGLASERKDENNVCFCSALVYIDKPRVRLTMDPSLPVREQDQRNVTLFCEVEAGNPASLDAVRWYLDGELLKELPECFNSSSISSLNNSDLCDDIDPSKLLLETVERSFQGNYTCRGRNEAGWGDASPNTELHVHCKMMIIIFFILMIVTIFSPSFRPICYFLSDSSRV